MTDVKMKDFLATCHQFKLVALQMMIVLISIPAQMENALTLALLGNHVAQTRSAKFKDIQLFVHALMDISDPLKRVVYYHQNLNVSSILTVLSILLVFKKNA